MRITRPRLIMTVITVAIAVLVVTALLSFFAYHQAQLIGHPGDILEGHSLSPLALGNIHHYSLAEQLR